MHMVKDGAFLMLYCSKFYLYTTDAEAEAEAPLLRPPIQTADSLEKTLMLGKIEGRRTRG